MAGAVRAESIDGKVTEVAGNEATLSISSKTQPVPGDAVVIYFKLPGFEEEVLVGTGKVASIAGGLVKVTVDDLKGTLQKDQLARIDLKASQPKSMTEPVVPPSPASSPLSTSAPATTDSRFSGEWSTLDPGASFNLKLTQTGNRVTGQYGLQGGEIVGEVKGDTLVMTWTLPHSRRGGSATLTLSTDGSALSGPWEYDAKVFDSGLSGGGTWTFRRSGTVPASPMATPARSSKLYAPPTDYVPKLGTAAAFNCDEGTGDVLTDNSNNGRPMKLHGGLGFAAGQQGTALDFRDSPKLYARREKDDTILNFADRDFTIELSCNFRGFPHEQVLLEKFSGKAGPGWTLTLLERTKLHFYAQGAGAFTAGVNLKPNQWYRFTVARRGSRLQMSVNDAVLLDETISGSIVPSTSPLLLGRRNEQDGRGFPVNGLIDDIRIEVVPPRRE